jgi:hypothetical protein
MRRCIEIADTGTSRHTKHVVSCGIRRFPKRLPVDEQPKVTSLTSTFVSPTWRFENVMLSARMQNQSAFVA